MQHMRQVLAEGYLSAFPATTSYYTQSIVPSTPSHTQ